MASANQQQQQQQQQQESTERDPLIVSNNNNNNNDNNSNERDGGNAGDINTTTTTTAPLDHSSNHSSAASSSSGSPRHRSGPPNRPGLGDRRASVVLMMDTMETILEVTSNVADVVVDAVVEVKDAVVEEMREVTDILVDELHQAADSEDDKYLFLDMGLARNLSILPGDVVDASHALQFQSLEEQQQQQQDQNQDQEQQPPGGAHVHRRQSSWMDFLPEPVVSVQEPEAGMMEQQQQHPATIPEGEVVTENEEEDGEQKPLLLPPLTKTSSFLPPLGGLQRIPSTRPGGLSKLPSIRPGTLLPAPPVSAYLLLLSAVVSLSSIGPLLELQHDVNAILKVSWRASGTAICLLPLAARAVYLEGWPHLTWSHWCMVPITGVAYTTMVVCFSMSLNYTAVGNAVILSNSQSLLLLLGKFLVGARITTVECTGALVAFSGAVLCSKDSSESAPSAFDDTASPYLTLFGDALALCSALGGVAYLIFAKCVRTHLNLYVFMFSNMFQTAIYSTLFCHFTGAPVSVDRNYYHGTFGWLNWDWDRLPLELVIVVVCNLLGAMGYVRAMQYFDALVIAVAALMEPVVAELMACLMGVGFLPGWKGWLGNALVTGGTLAVVYKPNKGNNSGGMH